MTERGGGEVHLTVQHVVKMLVLKKGIMRIRVDQPPSPVSTLLK